MNKMDNEILLSRAIQQNFLWSDKPFTMGQAWIDLLMLAEWKDKDVISKGSIVHLKRGQVGRAILWLAERWGWDRKRVARFLKILETQKMATTESTTKGTIITIENYDKYQLNGATDGANDGTTIGQPLDNDGTHPKKEKTEKTEKNTLLTPTVLTKTPYQKVIDAYHEECPSLPKVMKLTETRKKHIRARLDQHSVEEMREVFRKVQQSDFLMGRTDNRNAWRADFDFVTRSEDSVARILEGKYDNKNNKKDKAITDMREITQGMTRNDYEDMERTFK